MLASIQFNWRSDHNQVSAEPGQLWIDDLKAFFWAQSLRFVIFSGTYVGERSGEMTQEKGISQS